MRLIFNKDERLRKLIMIYQTFSHSDSLAGCLAEYAPLLGDNFYNASMVFNRLCSHLPRGNQDSFWMALSTEAGLEKKLNHRSDVLELLNKVYIPPVKGEYLEEIESGIRSMYSKYTPEHWIKKIFGSSPPCDVFIIPYEVYLVDSRSASTLVRNPPIICISGVSEKKREKLRIYSVFLHELLHCLVKDKLKKGTLPFEEALLDYFVPKGMLAEKLGLIKKLDMDKLCKRNKSRRINSGGESAQLLQAMKEYREICGKKTIWQFLREKGFGKYLKADG